MQRVNKIFPPRIAHDTYTLAALMMTEAQLKYLEDVLGVDPRNFPAAQAPQGPQTLVLTGPLESAEKDLLSKILASVQLGDYQLSENEDPRASHVLRFDTNIPSGRQSRETQVWWNLPSLKDMLGSSPQVTDAKKKTWNLLKQLERELRQ
jgi:hypothetical protein